jgi:methionine-rich copper-binding protein CopC
MLVAAPLAQQLYAARHIGLASSSPAKDSHVMKAPTEIRLTFTGPVDVQKAGVELLTADNKAVGLEPLQAVADSARVAVAKISAPLPGGKYTVRWKATAADGAAGSGSFGFMYMAPAGGRD